MNIKCSYIGCEENATCITTVMNRQIPSCEHHKDKFNIIEGTSNVLKCGPNPSQHVPIVIAEVFQVTNDVLTPSESVLAKNVLVN